MNKDKGGMWPDLNFPNGQLSRQVELIKKPGGLPEGEKSVLHPGAGKVGLHPKGDPWHENEW